MIAKTVFSFFPCVAIIISSITSYCFFKKADLLALHWNSNLNRLKYGVFVFPGPQPWPRALAPICFWWSRIRFVHIDPSRQFVFTSPAPQSVFVRPQPSICTYQTWLIGIGNNKIQRFHVMLLFLFLLSNSFVTVIDCCSLSFLLDVCVSWPLALALTPILN